MALKISSLKQLKNSVVDDSFFFKDLHLDFEKSSTFLTAFDKKVETNDIKVDYDELAIKNSLKNIFNTRPGERFLFPLFGLDLYEFLFSPITVANAEIIGEKIIRAIEDYEPRVYVNNCLVEADEDNNKYDITIIVEMPNLKKIIPIYTDLDLKTQTFIFVENARNR